MLNFEGVKNIIMGILYRSEEVKKTQGINKFRGGGNIQQKMIYIYRRIKKAIENCLSNFFPCYSQLEIFLSQKG